jgi:hypothetical protein
MTQFCAAAKGPDAAHAQVENHRAMTGTPQIVYSLTSLQQT